MSETSDRTSRNTPDRPDEAFSRSRRAEIRVVALQVCNTKERSHASIEMDLLGIYLILAGLVLLGVSIGGGIMDTIAGICAIIAGILFLINR